MNKIEKINIENRNKAIEWIREYLKYLLKLNQKRLLKSEKQNQLSGEEKETISLEEFLANCKELEKKIEDEADEKKKFYLKSEFHYYGLLYGDWVILTDDEIEEIVEFVAQAMRMAVSGAFSNITSSKDERSFAIEQLSRLAKSGKIEGEKQARLQKYIDYFKTNCAEFYTSTGFYHDLIGSISYSKDSCEISIRNKKLGASLDYNPNGLLEYTDSYGENIYFEENFPEDLFPRVGMGINEFLRNLKLDFLCQEVYTREKAEETLSLLYEYASNPAGVIDDGTVIKLADFFGDKVLEDECADCIRMGQDDSFVRQSDTFRKLIKRFKKVLVKAIKKFYATYGDRTIPGFHPFWVGISSESHVGFYRREGFAVELKKDQIIVITGKEKIDVNNIGTTYST